MRIRSPTLRQSGPEEWKPRSLRPISLLPFMLVNLAFLVTIPVLLAVSERNKGIASVSDTFSGLGREWKLSLLWTTLPSLAVTLLGAWWGSIADALAFREPFVELSARGRSGSGGPASRTILLDYLATPSLLRWWQALRLGHALVGLACLGALALGRAAPPLSAALLVARAVDFEDDVATERRLRRNASGIIDYRAVLDVVSATRLYRGSRIPWSSDEYAFIPVEIKESGGPKSSLGDVLLRAPTMAYSAYLNCTILQPEDDYSVSLTAGKEDAEGIVSGKIEIQAADRGCSFKYAFSASDEGDTTILDTRSVQSCPSSALYARLVFTYGISTRGAQNLLADMAVVSCISGFFETPGNLTVALLQQPGGEVDGDGGEQPSYVDFEPGAEKTEVISSLGSHVDYESEVLDIATFDVKSNWDTSAFGNLVLYSGALQAGQQGVDANSRRGAVRLSPDVLARSVQDMFTAVYATSVAIGGFSPAKDGSRDPVKGGVVVSSDSSSAVEQLDAVLRYTATRLVVVPWVAGVLTFVMAGVAVLAVWTALYLLRTGTMLREEPLGLASAAGLLHGSDLMDLAETVRSHPGYSGRFCEDASRKHGLRPEMKWKMDVLSDAQMRPVIIRSEQES